MVLAINAGARSTKVQRDVGKDNRAKGGALGRISSGLKIDKAVDDVAGFSIGRTMTGRIRGINQTMRNANEAISMVQVAQGALEGTANALQKIRELAVHAANDNAVTSNRRHLQDGIGCLLAEIEQIVGQSEMDNREVVEKSLRAGRESRGEVGSELDIIDSIRMAATASLVKVGDALRSSAQGNASLTVGRIDEALGCVAEDIEWLGGYQDQVSEVIAHLEIETVKTSGIKKRVIDARIAVSAVDWVRKVLSQDAAAAIQTQANQSPEEVLELLN